MLRECYRESSARLECWFPQHSSDGCTMGGLILRAVQHPHKIVAILQQTLLHFPVNWPCLTEGGWGWGLS